MPNPFEKSFEDILENILTDYRNQFPEADTSRGSLIFVKSAAMASALWGVHQGIVWVSRQMFADTASSEYLDRHAWLRGLTRKDGETDAEFLARYLEYRRRPPAGGTKSDYEKWATEVSGVSAAVCIPNPNDNYGTVKLVILSEEDDTAPSEDLLAAVEDYIDERRPITMKTFTVDGPDVTTVAVTMTVFGTGLDKPAIAADITAYMNTLLPGQTLYRSKLLKLAEDRGADGATLSAPAGDTAVAADEIVRPGAVTVS